ncbi:TlpA family protein disulfide reductase [Culturomica massiliensis]|uniref:TlpA family protein disulfide reductase n=1 Tax=Culturomica massiliensis TaxID=1841857 RepID=UPI000838FDAB|nr:TlpA disulfide reductase family protein [Culturomica massiliensis]
MYRKVFSLLVFLTGLVFLVSCTNRTTTISGTIDKQTKLLYSNPDLAVCFDNFLDTLVPDDQGRFELKFNLKEGRFMILKMPDSRNKYFIPVLPGEHYEISIGKNNEFSVDGANKEGIALYQSVLNYDPYTMKWSIFKNDTLSRDEMIKKIKQGELTQFKKLLDDKEITSSFYKLINDDRDCFYAFVAAWLNLWDMLAIYRRPETDESILAEKNTMKQLQNIFDRYKPDDKDFIKSPSWTEYALFMYTEIYLQYLKKHIDRDRIESLIDPEQHFSFWFEQTKQSFSGNRLESALALLIYRKGSEVESSIPAYRYFKEKYPVSPYLNYFEEQMNETIELYTGNKSDPSIRFTENSDSINSLSALISRFKGKKLYVDVWATWCAPCRKEFQYKDSLEIILEQHDITPLYISLDNENQNKKWKALVYANHLKGFHFRANQAFIDDLKLYWGGEKGKKSFLIPWYMLIDENGNILEKHARRPSEIVATKRLSD